MFSNQIPVVFLMAAAGILGVLGACQLTRVSWRFVRLTAILALAVNTFLLTVAVVRGWWSDGENGRIMLIATAGAAVASFVVLTIAPLLPRAAGWIRGTCWIGMLAAGVAGWLMAPAVPSWLPALAGYALGSFLVGAVTVGWLLGHRYLTATDMTIDPLAHLSRLIVGALVGRWLFLAAALAVVGLAPVDGLHSRWSDLMQDWLIVAIRIGVGLVIPTVFVAMAWQCVRLRSTQSATGILFFTSIFIIIGELASHYLVVPAGLPL